MRVDCKSVKRAGTSARILVKATFNMIGMGRTAHAGGEEGCVIGRDGTRGTPFLVVAGGPDCLFHVATTLAASVRQSAGARERQSAGYVDAIRPAAEVGAVARSPACSRVRRSFVPLYEGEE